MKDAELAILSIFAEAPRAGWDVQDVIEARDMRLWTLLGVESIYYVIEKLEKQGLILNTDEHPPRDSRKRLYRITGAGIGVLQTAVTDLLGSPRVLPQSFDLGLANLAVLKPMQAYNALMAYESGLKTRLAALKRQKQYAEDRSLPFHIMSMFEHQIMLIETELAWFAEWLPLWQAQAPPESEESSHSPRVTPRMEQVILPGDADSFHKHPTREHSQNSDDVEFPPPPEKRLPTRPNHSTPTSNRPEDTQN
jgi:DNA-binding PadR family transcriptional regulator